MTAAAEQLTREQVEVERVVNEYHLRLLNHAAAIGLSIDPNPPFPPHEPIRLDVYDPDPPTK